MTSTDGEAPLDSLEILTFDSGGFRRIRTAIVGEVPLEVLLNGRRIITIACAGNHVDELAVGFLRSEGMIGSAREIEGIDVSPSGSVVRVSTRGGPPPGDPGEIPLRTLSSSGARSALAAGRPVQTGPLPQGLRLSPQQITRLMDGLIGACRLHDASGGTHGAALANPGGIIVSREDIGRHNAIDMLGGFALMKGIDCADKIVVRTGRVSAEIVQKLARLRIPLVISISVPTTLAVRLAREAGMTLVGSVRGGRMNIYTGEERVSLT